MDSDRLLTAVKSEGQALILAVERAPTSQVSACPGWSNKDLADHMCKVWSFVAAQVSAQNPLERSPSEVGGSTDPVEILGHLDYLLNSTDPETPIWTWTPHGTVGFYIRRMAHENTIHRWDAERASGSSSPLIAELAADGIDEALEVAMVHRSNGDPVQYPSGSLHLHRTDGAGEWLVSAVDNQLVVKREHVKGDAALRGTAEGLLLYLWGRQRSDLECFGDQNVIEAWGTVTP